MILACKKKKKKKKASAEYKSKMLINRLLVTI